MLRYLCFLVFVFFLMISNRSFAQDILRGENLRNIKVDQLTDNDILKFQQQLKAVGITQQQAEQIAISKGMPLSEIQKLRQRILQVNAKLPQTNMQSTQGNLQHPLTIIKPELFFVSLTKNKRFTLAFIFHVNHSPYVSHLVITLQNRNNCVFHIPYRNNSNSVNVTTIL